MTLEHIDGLDYKAVVVISDNQEIYDYEFTTNEVMSYGKVTVNSKN